MEKTNSISNCYRNLVLNCKTPILIRESLHWNVFKWSLLDWSNVFQGNILKFRCGKKQCKKYPLWEGQCITEHSTFEEFLQFCSDDTRLRNEWKYYDYKHIAECFDLKVFEAISWETLGFPEKGAESSTLWIGSLGAHTPCHIDTYGCNIVVQVYGRKRWILFPFDEAKNLKATRVPYEESSVYSNVNFFCYHSVKDMSFENCFMIDLDPGDILLIPPKWWHYVENLSTAISINTWIPHENDDDWRIQEGLVKFFISSIATNLPEELKEVVLNPNERNVELSSVCLRILSYCKGKDNKKDALGNLLIPCDTYKNVVHTHEYRLIPRVSSDTLKSELMRCSNCIPCDTDFTVDNNEIENITAVINAFCHPSVIIQIKNKFLEI